MSCYSCKHFSELKKPRVQKDKDKNEYTIYGYCFKKNFEKPYNDGYPVYLPEGTCKHFEGIRAIQRQCQSQLTLDLFGEQEGEG